VIHPTVDDDAGAFEDAKVIPGAGDSLGTLSLRDDSAYRWNGKCVVGAKLCRVAGGRRIERMSFYLMRTMRPT
jgi:hypothetical protein